MERSEHKTKKKQKTAIIFALKRNEVKRKRKTAIIFASKRNESEKLTSFSLRSEMKKRKRNLFRFDAKF
jgi:hypothetical protein